MRWPTLLLIAMISTSYLYSQDESRLGVRFGYSQDLKGLALASEYKNSYKQVVVGLDRTMRYSRKRDLAFGLDFFSSNLIIPSDSFGVIFLPEEKDTYYGLGLHLGMKRYFMKRKLFSYFGIMLEYDFSAPNDPRHRRQNGLGIFYTFGTDIHVSEDFVLSIMPMAQVHGFPNFNKGDALDEDDFPMAGLIDWGLRIVCAKKEY